jgi:hypothetical protein
MGFDNHHHTLSNVHHQVSTPHDRPGGGPLLVSEGLGQPCGDKSISRCCYAGIRMVLVSEAVSAGGFFAYAVLTGASAGVLAKVSSSSNHQPAVGASQSHCSATVTQLHGDPRHIWPYFASLQSSKRFEFLCKPKADAGGANAWITRNLIFHTLTWVGSRL